MNIFNDLDVGQDIPDYHRGLNQQTNQYNQAKLKEVVYN